MEKLIYILFGLLILSIIVLVAYILIKCKISVSESFGNHPAGDRKLEDTLIENKGLLLENYGKKDFTEDVSNK